MSVLDTAAGRAFALIVASLFLATMGCSLFSSFDLPGETTSARQVLPPIKAPSDAVQLQVVFIERPVDDSLVNQLLWQELDQVGAISPATRQVLEQNGFRVGQSGANPPPVLQKLLGLTGELSEDTDDSRRMMNGRRLGLRSGQETEIRTLDTARDLSIRYALTGKEETINYTQAQPVLKLRPVRVQNGWVRLELLPEIHHGESRLRHIATDDGWAMRGGQECDARQALQFHVMLNNGELAVIGSRVEQPETAGHRMFCQNIDGRGTQRLLVVRLATSGRTDQDLTMK